MIAQRSAVPKKEYHILTESDPSAGHTRSDTQNTAPFIPKTLDLSSGELISASTAWATEAFHPVIPSNIRERNIISIGRSIKPNTSLSGTRYAHHNTTQLKNVPHCVSIRTGFLPKLSLIEPRIGAAKNWNKLKVQSNIHSTTSGSP